MIGIVVVSHSHALAEAAVALATEMTDPENRPVITVAAGLDAETFGTDAAAVAEAIAVADSGDGVIVLLDLGSAVLSAELALEFVDPQLAQRVRLSSGPLVEGLVGAAVAAAAGADLATAAGEAEQGLRAKSQHLSAGSADSEAAPPEPQDGRQPQEGADEQDPSAEAERAGEDALIRELPVTAHHGLHARPAARFVREVGGYPDVRVRVRNLTSGGPFVDGRSLTGVATLDARQGHRIEVSATGESAADLLEALARLADSGFGDLGALTASGAGVVRSQTAGSVPGQQEQADETAVTARTGPTFGLDAAVGRVVRDDRQAPLADYRGGDADQELAALEQAVTRARAELSELVARTRDHLGADEAAVFEAHLAMLDDPALQDPVRAGIRAGQSAPDAVGERAAQLRDQFAGLADPYQRERGADVTSVGDRLLRALTGTTAAPPESAGVLVTQRLDPATAVLLDAVKVLGVITIGGSASGHGVLLARARGLPVLTGASAARDVREGTLVAFDVRSGRLASSRKARSPR